MLKKTIEYSDFNDVKHTEDFYFNLTKAEIIEMELTAEGNSFVTYIENVAKSNNGKLIMDTFKSIIFKAYGEKSEDGKRFVKSEQISLDFSHTGAYDVLYVELVTDAEKSAEFINGLVPEEIAKAAANSDDPRIKAMEAMQGHKKKQEAPKKTVEVIPELPAGEPVLESYNEHKAVEKIEEPDIASMTREQLIAHYSNKN